MSASTSQITGTKRPPKSHFTDPFRGKSAKDRWIPMTSCVFRRCECYGMCTTHILIGRVDDLYLSWHMIFYIDKLPTFIWLEATSWKLTSCSISWHIFDVKGMSSAFSENKFQSVGNRLSTHITCICFINGPRACGSSQGDIPPDLATECLFMF